MDEDDPALTSLAQRYTNLLEAVFSRSVLEEAARPPEELEDDETEAEAVQIAGPTMAALSAIGLLAGAV